ncbi:hypothetical protein MELB17_04067 [Marinobacter sp. ELB17]|nr:hypothetical protein MELB17_04067 [Marinobacter sp. ELB17]
MRLIAAVDLVSRKEMVAHSDNLPNCCQWALKRAHETGRPIKIVTVRPGDRVARVIAEATRYGIRHVHAGVPIDVKKLKRAL